MQSPGYREKAWGAYLAGQYGLQDRADDVLSQLAALSSSNTLRGDAECAAIQATLDAMIRLGYRPNAAVLVPFQKQWPNEVLVLLAQDPPSNREVLLSMAGQPDPIGERWVAVRNLLVEFRSAGVAALLLSEVNVSHLFHVVDGTGFKPAQELSRGGAIDSGLVPMPDFPPAGVYDLVLSPQRGDVLVAPGTHPVYYRRATTGGHTFREVDRQLFCLEYLAELSGLPLDTIKQALAPSKVIRWTNTRVYKGQVSAAISAQRLAIAQLLEKLRATGVLGTGQADVLQLRILIDQDDQRRLTREALPNLLPVPVREK